MQEIYCACYISLIISFIRKIIDKLTLKYTGFVPVFERDDSDYWNLEVCGKSVAYQWGRPETRDEVMRVAEHIIAEIPALAGRVMVVRDGSSPIHEVEDISILGRDARELLGDILDESDLLIAE